MAQYIALIDETEDGFGAQFPDCPGCTAMGNTIEDVIADATAALREWMDDRSTAGLEPPPARSITELRAEEPNLLSQESVAVVIRLMSDETRLVQTDVTLDPDLLEQIDGAAKRRGLTRSAFLAAAARDKILTTT